MVSKEIMENIFYKDNFLKLTGVVIEEVTSSHVLCSMKIEEKHRNEMGNVQGGAIFTLCDSVFAIMCNYKAVDEEGDSKVVSRSSNIVYLKPAKGTTLYARGENISEGKKMVYTKVSVYDDLGTDVAFFTGDGFRLK